MYLLTFSGDINFSNVAVLGGDRGLVGGDLGLGDLGAGEFILGVVWGLSLGVMSGVRSKAPDMLMRSNALVLFAK